MPRHPDFPPAILAGRLARLARAANVSRWFRYPAQPTHEHFSHHLADADLDLIVSLGFTAVRLAVAEDQIAAWPSRDAPDPRMLSYVGDAIGRMVARGLAVVVVVHDVSRGIERAGDELENFLRLSASFARHLSATDPEYVVLEPLNEPVFDRTPSAWFPVRDRLLRVVREAAPRHTLVTGGPNWSSVDGLLMGRAAGDPNVVYTFHFYEPFVFTHQGAPWVDHAVSRLRDVPYPSSPRAVAALLRTVEHDPQAYAALAQYGGEAWDARQIEGRVAAAARWGRTHGAAVWAGEFGAFPPVAPRKDRLQWIADTRIALERHGIGWAVWSYDEGLGLDRQVNAGGRVAVDWGAAAALGLRGGTDVIV